MATTTNTKKSDVVSNSDNAIFDQYLANLSAYDKELLMKYGLTAKPLHHLLTSIDYHTVREHEFTDNTGANLLMMVLDNKNTPEGFSLSKDMLKDHAVKQYRYQVRKALRLASEDNNTNADSEKK